MAWKEAGRLTKAGPCRAIEAERAVETAFHEVTPALHGPQVQERYMYGAIIGDIVGSPWEFHRIKTKQFPLFGRAKRGDRR